jgi:hypothetical protein
MVIMYASTVPATGAAGLLAVAGGPVYAVLGAFALIAAWSAVLRVLPLPQA